MKIRPVHQRHPDIHLPALVEHRQRDLSNAPDWLGAVTDLPERSSDILTEYIGNPFSSDDEDPDPADDTAEVPVTDADETDTSEE